MANIDNITAGTLGGNDWIYDNAVPFAAYKNLTIFPFYVFGLPLLPYGSQPEGEDYYNDYIKNKVSLYAQYNGVTGLPIEFLNGPMNKVTGYKMAFFVEFTLGEDPGCAQYTLYGNVGNEVRALRYSDLVVTDHPDESLWVSYHSATQPPNYNPLSGNSTDGGEDVISFDIENVGVGIDSKIYSYVPYFTKMSELTSYLSSPDIDPTQYNGIWGGEFPTPAPEDLNTPGDNIEGLFTDLGFDLSNGPVRAFICTNSELADLATKMGDGWFANNIGDAVISIKMIKTPGAIATHSNEPQVIIPSSTLSSTEVTGEYVENQFQHFEFGTYTIPESYNSFLDYNNTSVSLYLPFSGLHQLDAKTVMGGRITLDASVDYISGMVTWYVTVTRDGVNQTIYEWSGNCSMEIPLTAIDYAQKVTQLVSGVLTTASGIASSNPIYAIGGVVQTVQAASDEYITIGNISSNAGWTGIMYPFLIFQRTKPAYPDNYNSLMGKPSMKKATLSSLTGFTKIAEVHLDNIVATSKEKDKLMSLLKSGVIL